MKWGSARSLDRPSEAIDRPLFIAMVTLALFGALMSYSATRQLLINAGDNPQYYFKRQLTWAVVSIVVMFLVSRLDFRKFEMVSTPLYIAVILALAGVLAVGSSSLGAQRWYNLGFMQVQPSEFSVLAVILAVSTYCARRPEGLTMYDVRRILTMAAVPILLILAQPDLGTSILMILTVAVILMVAGVPPRFMAVLGAGGVASLAMFIFVGLLHPYQVARLTSFVNQNYNGNDPDILKLLYQVAHSKNAIGAGGFSGAGLFGGLQTTLGYVPESKTDFIFAVVGEQMGLLGTTALVALLSFIAYRMFRISRESHDALGRFIAMGAYVFFAFSCFQNIGMTLGIMPVTGIPLPMISYGGSSAVVFALAGGAVLSISKRVK